MTLWDRLCCVGYGIQARWDGIWHLVRGHKLHWRDRGDLWIGCTGDIWCEACPDHDGIDLSIWCRFAPWKLWIAQRICSLIGHPGYRFAQRWSFEDDKCIDTMGRCCTRCLAKFKGK